MPIQITSGYRFLKSSNRIISLATRYSLLATCYFFFLTSSFLFAQAQFEYLGSISRPSDIGVKKTIFKKGVEFFFGKTEEEERIINPYGITSDGKGKIYIADNGSGLVHLFDLEKKKYQQIYKLAQGRLVSPLTCVVDFRRNLYILDNYWMRIFVFDKKGKYVKEIVLPQDVINPVGIAMSNYFLYLVDMKEHKVWIYNLAHPHKPKGWFYSFGRRGEGDGEFNFPTNIFVDRKNKVYVTDTMNFRVQIFNEDGKFLSKFGQIGDSPGQFSRPKGIAVDSQGNIFIVDALRETIEVYDQNSQYLGFLGGEGKNPGQFSLPSGIYIDCEDKIYVADSFNRRIQIFRFFP